MKLLRAGSDDETDGQTNEAILPDRRRRPETNRCSDLHRWIKQRGAIMWDFINVLYREYCLARLTEMRRLELNR